MSTAMARIPSSSGIRSAVDCGIGREENKSAAVRFKSKVDPSGESSQEVETKSSARKLLAEAWRRAIRRPESA